VLIGSGGNIATGAAQRQGRPNVVKELWHTMGWQSQMPVTRNLGWQSQLPVTRNLGWQSQMPVTRNLGWRRLVGLPDNALMPRTALMSRTSKS